MDILDKIKKEFDEFELRKKQFVEELRKDFPVIFVHLFEKSELIESISWTQYTPYFNDGSECVFRVHTDLYVNDEYYEDVEFLDKSIIQKITAENLEEHKEFNSNCYGREWYLKRQIGEDGNFKNPNFNEKEFKVVEEFKDTLQSIPDEFMKDLFDDHSKIIVYRNGEIKVNKYEHD